MTRAFRGFSRARARPIVCLSAVPGIASSTPRPRRPTRSPAATASRSTSRATRTRSTVQFPANFDIISGPFLTHFSRVPHAVLGSKSSDAPRGCALFGPFAQRMLIGACNLTACPNWGFRRAAARRKPGPEADLHLLGLGRPHAFAAAQERHTVAVLDRRAGKAPARVLPLQRATVESESERAIEREDLCNSLAGERDGRWGWGWGGRGGVIHG